MIGYLLFSGLFDITGVKDNNISLFKGFYNFPSSFFQETSHYLGISLVEGATECFNIDFHVNHGLR